MMSEPLPGEPGSSSVSADEPLWIPAAVLFGGGDVLTTLIGFSVGAVESNPLPARAIGHAAATVTPLTVATLVVLKILTVSLFVVMWALFPVARFGLTERWRATVPAVLSAVGAAVVVYNSLVIHALTV